MYKIFLHRHTEFPALIRIVSNQRGIHPTLVEKDYWIMHCLYGLQQLGWSFGLKGGTSLSKAYEIIHRFSEDIDIRIDPPKESNVKFGRNQNKPAHCETRKVFYDHVAKSLTIDGIESVYRDTAFDDDRYRSGGIRLHYQQANGSLSGVKEGILLELGFDDVTPSQACTISS